MKKNKKRIVNQFTYDPTVKSAKERSGGISKTIPDQSLTLKQIVSKYVSTGIMPEAKVVYDADNPMPDFDSMDVQDKIEYGRSVQDFIHEKQEQLKRAKAQSKVLAESEKKEEKGEEKKVDSDSAESK